ERSLLLERVEHLADRVGHADDPRLHDDRGLARGLDVARGHRSAGPFMWREDVFELRPVDERLVELRILACGIAEHVFHPARDELFGKGCAAASLKRLDPDGSRASAHLSRRVRWRWSSRSRLGALGIPLPP